MFVTPKGEVLDGQHRIAAFRMLKEKYPDSKAALPVMVVNIDELALLSAIEFNSEHANWVIEDYMRAHLEKGIHGYEQLHDFTLNSKSKLQSSLSRVSTLRKSSKKEL